MNPTDFKEEVDVAVKECRPGCIDITVSELKQNGNAQEALLHIKTYEMYESTILYGPQGVHILSSSSQQTIYDSLHTALMAISPKYGIWYMQSVSDSLSQQLSMLEQSRRDSSDGDEIQQQQKQKEYHYHHDLHDHDLPPPSSLPPPSTTTTSNLGGGEGGSGPSNSTTTTSIPPAFTALSWDEYLHAMAEQHTDNDEDESLQFDERFMMAALATKQAREMDKEEKEDTHKQPAGKKE